MKNNLSDSVKNLLNSSRLAAVITDGNFSRVWNNRAYEKKYLPFTDAAGFSRQFPQFSADEIEALAKSPAGSSIKKEKTTVLKSGIKNAGTFMLTVFDDDLFNDSESVPYKNIFDNSARPMIILECPGGAVRDVNAAFSSLCGVPAEHIRTVSARDLPILRESDGFKNYFAAKTPYKEPFRVSFTDAGDEKRFFKVYPSAPENGLILFEMEDESTPPRKSTLYTGEVSRPSLTEGGKKTEADVLDSLRSLIIVFDKDGELSQCNRAFLDFFMCGSLEDFKNRFGSIEKLFINEYGFINESCGKFWFRKVAENTLTEYKLVIRNERDGRERIFFVSVSLVSQEDSSYAAVLSDITETVQTTLALKDANSLLLMYNESIKSEMDNNLGLLAQQTKLAMMGEMIGIITHQWKQPLNAIGLIAQNIEVSLEEDEAIDRQEIKDMTGSIMKHVIAMGETVDNFRNFFKNASAPKLFNLHNAIDSAMMLLQPVLKKAAVSVNINKPEKYDGLMLRGSANEFKQVLLNIIINSKDAIGAKIIKGEAEPGSGLVAINIERRGDNILINIKDNGTGLSPDTIKNIFNMQYTTKGEGGTGIGMYMSEMIIKKMSGRIWAENWDAGASVSIELPVQSDPEPKP